MYSFIEIRAVVLSEDKAQDKGKHIIVVNCYYYYFIFCCQIIIQYVSMNKTFLAVVGVHERE